MVILQQRQRSDAPPAVAAPGLSLRLDSGAAAYSGRAVAAVAAVAPLLL